MSYQKAGDIAWKRDDSLALHCSTIGASAMCRRYEEGIRLFDYGSLSLFSRSKIRVIQEQPLNLQDVPCLQDYGESEIGD